MGPAKRWCVQPIKSGHREPSAGTAEGVLIPRRQSLGLLSRTPGTVKCSVMLFCYERHRERERERASRNRNRNMQDSNQTERGSERERETAREGKDSERERERKSQIEKVPVNSNLSTICMSA